MEDRDSPVAGSPEGSSLLLTIEETAAQLRIGRTRTYELVMGGQIRSVTIGRRRLVVRADLEEFVRRLSDG
jgi:excisionase family DNA binding protein